MVEGRWLRWYEVVGWSFLHNCYDCCKILQVDHQLIPEETNHNPRNYSQLSQQYRKMLKSLHYVDYHEHEIAGSSQ